MNTPSFKFKKMICSLKHNERNVVILPIYNWLLDQISLDSKAGECYKAFEELYRSSMIDDDKTFKEHYIWNIMPNYDSCVSFQKIVTVKGVPPNTPSTTQVKQILKRNSIPKNVRGEVWKFHFGNSTKGECFCCKRNLDAFENWHAGHIISRACGGSDTADNLRPVCGSCNSSMGTEHMDTFKARCYPQPI